MPSSCSNPMPGSLHFLLGQLQGVRESERVMWIIYVIIVKVLHSIVDIWWESINRDLVEHPVFSSLMLPNLPFKMFYTTYAVIHHWNYPLPPKLLSTCFVFVHFIFNSTGLRSDRYPSSNPRLGAAFPSFFPLVFLTYKLHECDVERVCYKSLPVVITS